MDGGSVNCNHPSTVLTDCVMMYSRCYWVECNRHTAVPKTGMQCNIRQGTTEYQVISSLKADSGKCLIFQQICSIITMTLACYEIGGVIVPVLA